VANPSLNVRPKMNSQPALSNPLAKPCHEAWVDRQVVAEVFFVAEVLPVGVLYPAGHPLFVGDVAKHQKTMKFN